MRLSRRFFCFITLFLAVIVLSACAGDHYYMVSFDAAGGLPEPEYQMVQNGRFATEPEELPVKDGYVFKGWFLSGNKYDFKTPVLANLVLVAKWNLSDNQFSVSFDTNGGSPLPFLTIDGGDKIVEPHIPIKVGYTFAGWFKDESLTMNWDFMTDIVTGDIILYAKWEVREVDVLRDEVLFITTKLSPDSTLEAFSSAVLKSDHLLDINGLNQLSNKQRTDVIQLLYTTLAAHQKMLNDDAQSSMSVEKLASVAEIIQNGIDGFVSVAKLKERITEVLAADVSLYQLHDLLDEADTIVNKNSYHQIIKAVITAQVSPIILGLEEILEEKYTEQIYLDGLIFLVGYIYNSDQLIEAMIANEQLDADRLLLLSTEQKQAFVTMLQDALSDDIESLMDNLNITSANVVYQIIQDGIDGFATALDFYQEFEDQFNEDITTEQLEELITKANLIISTSYNKIISVHLLEVMLPAINALEEFLDANVAKQQLIDFVAELVGLLEQPDTSSDELLEAITNSDLLDLNELTALSYDQQLVVALLLYQSLNDKIAGLSEDLTIFDQVLEVYLIIQNGIDGFSSAVAFKQLVALGLSEDIMANELADLVEAGKAIVNDTSYHQIISIDLNALLTTTIKSLEKMLDTMVSQQELFDTLLDAASKIADKITAQSNLEETYNAIILYGEEFGLDITMFQSLSLDNQKRAVGILKDAVEPFEELLDEYFQNATLDEVILFQQFLNYALYQFSKYVLLEEQFDIVFDANGYLNDGKTKEDGYALYQIIQELLRFEPKTWHEKQLANLIKGMVEEYDNKVNWSLQVIFVSNQAELIAANKANNIIVLLNDIEQTTKLALVAGVTLDGNGHSLIFKNIGTGTENKVKYDGNVIMLANGSNITIRNIHIINEVELNGTSKYNIIQWYGSANKPMINGLVENVVIENKNSAGVNAAIKLYGVATGVVEVTVNNVTTLNTGWNGIYLEDYSTLNVSGFGFHAPQLGATYYYQTEIGVTNATASVNVSSNLDGQYVEAPFSTSRKAYMSIASFNYLANNIESTTIYNQIAPNSQYLYKNTVVRFIARSYTNLKTFLTAGYALAEEILLLPTSANGAINVAVNTIANYDVTIIIGANTIVNNIENLTVAKWVNCTLVIEDGATISGTINPDITVIYK